MKTMIKWGSPKYYQRGWESESNSNPAKLPKPKSKYCKRLKGAHDMQLKKQTLHKWWPLTQGKGTQIEEYRCTGCDRKDLRFITIDL